MYLEQIIVLTATYGMETINMYRMCLNSYKQGSFWKQVNLCVSMKVVAATDE